LFTTSGADAKTGSPALASRVSELARTDFLAFLVHAPRAAPNATFVVDPLLNKVYSDQIMADIRANATLSIHL
jgi:hypothetical protein